jgi:flagellar assembly protein FliH
MHKILRADAAVTHARWTPPQHFVPPPPEPLPSQEEVLARFMEEGERHARALIEAAVTEAQRIKQEAYDEGYAQGSTEGAQAYFAKLGEVAALAGEVAESREAFYQAVEPGLVKIAVAVAEKVLAQQLALAPEMVVEMVRVHLQRLRDRYAVTVRVHPDDVNLLLDAQPSLRHAVAGLQEFDIVGDATLERGDVVIESEHGSFDARLSSQMAILRRALIDDAEVACEPAVL